MVILAIVAIALPAVAVAFLAGGVGTEFGEAVVVMAVVCTVVAMVAWGSAYLAHAGVW